MGEILRAALFIYDLNHLRFTIYDLRFTIYDLRFGNLARLRRGNFAKQVRTHIRKAVIGRSYKGTEVLLIYNTPSTGPSCVLTHRHHPAGLPFGQRMRAVHTHLPPSCVLTHRRPIGGSPFGQRMRAVHTHLQPSCVLYVVHG